MLDFAIVLFIGVIGIISFTIQFLIFRKVGAKQPLKDQLNRLTGLPIFVPFYGVLVLVASCCGGKLHLWLTLVCFLLAAVVSVGCFILQFVLFLSALEEGILQNRAVLAQESPEVRRRLMWYLTHFRWVPRSKLRNEQLVAVIKELAQLP